MLTTVIINNYNYARFLPEAIESVISQTYKNLEIIIIDDASSDNSPDIIQNYAQKDKRIKPIIKRQNLGQAHSLNIGVENSNGEIILFLDSDDKFNEKKVEKVVKQFNNGFEYIVNNYKIIGDTSYNYAPYFPYGGYNLFLVYYNSLFTGGTTSCISISSSLASIIFPIRYENFFRIRADDPIVISASLIKEMYFIEEPLTEYRIHGKNYFASIYKKITYKEKYQRDIILHKIKKNILNKENFYEQFFHNPFHLLLEFQTKQVYDLIILKKYLKLLFFEIKCPFFKKIEIGVKIIKYYIAQKFKNN